MKKITKLLMLPLFATLALSGCEKAKREDVTPSGEGGEQQPQVEATISLNKSSLALKVNQSFVLIATVANGTGSVTWSSSNEAVATVNAEGKVDAHTVGNAVITASYSGKTASCNVAVAPEDAKIVASIELTPASLTLDTVTHTSATLTPTVVADEGADTTVTWVSNNTNVVTVSKATGVANEAITVTVVGKGTTTITATAGAQTATCPVTVQGVDDLYYLSGVQENANIKTFHTNVEDTEDDFRGATSPILQVGDYNPVQLKPILKVRDSETDATVNQDVWEFDYRYEAQEWNGAAYGNLTGEHFVFDAQNCTFDFADSAVGKQFKITVIPGGLDEEDSALPENRVSVELKVNTGYNVYTAKELAYANDIAFAQDDRQGNDGVIADINAAWVNFRSQTGLSTSYVAPAIYLQSDIKITKDALPSEFFFTASDPGVQPEWIGKMKDATDVYCHYARGYEFNGNYFHIDTQDVPLCEDNLSYDDNVSHTTLFKTVLREYSLDEGYVDVNFKNCSYFGNSPRGNNPADSMGLIFFKINNKFYPNDNDYPNNLIIRGIFDNFNVTRACISFFGEVSQNEIVIKNCEVSEGYSNCIYLWDNGTVRFENSLLSNFGGPVIITDGDGTDGGKMTTVKGFHVYADEPTVFNNYVTGSEPWFTNTMGGLPGEKMSDIKMLNGMVQGTTGGAKSFVKGANEEMNMIIINYGEIPYLQFQKESSKEDEEHNPLAGQLIGIDTESPLEPYVQGALSNGAPVWYSDIGHAITCDAEMNPIQLYGGVPLLGDYLDVIHCLHGVDGFDDGLFLSIVFGL